MLGTTIDQAKQWNPQLVADRDLVKAIASADVEEIRKALEEHSMNASPDTLAEARQARERLKKKARKKAAKSAEQQNA